MNEPELPPIASRTVPLTSRKRSHPVDEPPTSSDPALFSSDDHAPTADNYASKRRKDVWAGAWWGIKTLPMRKKRSFRRNFDSGIFLGSEETDTSVEDEILKDLCAADATPRSHVFGVAPISGYRNVAARASIKQDPTSAAHMQVRTIVQKCLDQGIEDVDLSGMLLDSLPSDIKALKTMTKHSVVPEFTPSQEAYHPIEAQLRLFLANNLFTKVPREVLTLTNLCVLSIRQNNLTAIPNGFRNLHNLKSLNISGNKLSSLPMEILDLVHYHELKELIADPNPWAQVPDGAEKMSRLQAHDGNSGARLRKVAQGAATNFHCSGSVARTSAKLIFSACPSLVEMSLSRISRLQGLETFVDQVDDDVPESVHSLLLRGRDAEIGGGYECSTCHRSIVVPRKQWTEWWSLDYLRSGPFLTLPFLRIQCSVTCSGPSVDRSAQWYDDNHISDDLELRSNESKQ